MRRGELSIVQEAGPYTKELQRWVYQFILSFGERIIFITNPDPVLPLISEAEEDKHLDGQHAVEEAMSTYFNYCGY